MSGNVYEWCLDRYGEYTGDQTDPKGPSNFSGRVGRSGAWDDGARYCRSATRGFGEPGNRSSALGLRLALVPVQ